MSNTKLSATQAVANIQINGVVLSPDGIPELRDLQDGENEGLDAHTEALIEVTSFLLEIADEMPAERAPRVLRSCKALNYVRNSLLVLRSPVRKEVIHD
ncbi:MAG: hypothetical protein V2A67_04400 [Bacteroidota bacterium]